MVFNLTREKAFIGKIKAVRNKEVAYNKVMFYVEIVSYVLTAFAPTLVVVTTIGIYIYSGLGSDLSAEKIFVSITISNLL